MSQSTYYQKSGSKKNPNQSQKPQKSKGLAKSGLQSSTSTPVYYQRSGGKENSDRLQRPSNSPQNRLWNRMPKWSKIATYVLGGLVVIGIASSGSDDAKSENKSAVIETEVADSDFEVNEISKDSNEDSDRSIVEDQEKSDEEAKKAELDKKAEEERLVAEKKEKAEEEKVEEEKKAAEAEVKRTEEEKKKAEEAAAAQKAIEEATIAQEATGTADVQQVPQQVDSLAVANGTESPNALLVIQMGPTTGSQCWVPRNGGKKYHSKSSCSGMDDPILTTVDTATACGFDACKKCH